jgi:hypothetical protein
VVARFSWSIRATWRNVGADGRCQQNALLLNARPGAEWADRVSGPTLSTVMTPLPLPLRPPFYEMGMLRASRSELRSVLGTPHHVETDCTRTSGGEEDTWAFLLPSGQRVAIVLRVPYQAALVYAYPADKEPLFGITGVPAGDERWTWSADPRLVPRPERTANRWTVWRQDDSGNRFLVALGLSHSDAAKMVSEFEQRGHKQSYWAERRENEGGRSSS